MQDLDRQRGMLVLGGIIVQGWGWASYELVVQGGLRVCCWKVRDQGQTMVRVPAAHQHKLHTLQPGTQRTLGLAQSNMRCGGIG